MLHLLRIFIEPRLVILVLIIFLIMKCPSYNEKK